MNKRTNEMNKMTKKFIKREGGGDVEQENQIKECNQATFLVTLTTCVMVL